MRRPPIPSGAIWPPDWSQFIPDLAGSAIVGLLVGVAIWRFQSTVEDRAAERDAFGSWNILRHQIASHFRKPLDLDSWSGSWDSVWMQVKGVSEKGYGVQVGALLAAAPKNPELKQVGTFLVAVDRLSVLGLNLNDLLNRAMLRKGRVEIGHESKFSSVAWFMLRGQVIDYHNNFAVVDGVKEIAGLALSDPDVAASVEEFIALERSVIAQYAELRDSLTQA